MAYRKSELLVITKAKELCAYVMTVTQKSPKAYRYTFVSRLQNLSLDVIEHLYRANDMYVAPGKLEYYRQRFELQRRAMTDLRLLCYIAEISAKQGCILMKQYEQISKQAGDCQNLLGAWVSSDRKRLGV